MALFGPSISAGHSEIGLMVRFYSYHKTGLWGRRLNIEDVFVWILNHVSRSITWSLS